MKKVEMIDHLKSKINEASRNMIDWYEILEGELEKNGTSFNEALENKTLFGLIEYKAWREYNDENYVLRQLLKDFQTK